MIKCIGIFVSFFSALLAILLVCTPEAPTDLSSPEQAYSTIILSSTSLRVSDTTVVDSVGKTIDVKVVMHAGIFIDSVQVRVFSGLPTDGAAPDTVITARFSDDDLRDTLRYQIVFATPGIKTFEVVSYKKLDYISSVTASAFILGDDESNSPPVFVPDAPKGVYRFEEGALVRFPVQATDFNNDSISYLYFFSDNPLPREETVTFKDGYFSWQSAPGDSGKYPVSFTAYDRSTMVTANTVILIGNVAYNSPPRITTTPEAIAQPGILYQYTPQAVDDENGVLRWTLSGDMPQDMVFNPATGTIKWVPAPGEVSSGKLTLTVTDDGDPAASSSQTVFVNVAGANRPPSAYGHIVATGLDMPIDIIMLADDPENDPLTYYIVKNPLYGSITVRDDSVIVYKPGVGFKGVDTIRFVVSDAQASSDTARILVYIAYDNQKPTAVSKQVVVREDEASVITLAASDPEGRQLTYAIVSGPDFGVLSGITASRTYTPNGNFNGTDTFTYIANDGTLDSDPAKIFISVTAVNDTPVANNIGVPVAENTAITIPVSVADPDDSVFTVSIVDLPRHGSAEVTTDMAIRYVPENGFTGTDTVQYRVTDEQGAQSNTARMIIVTGGEYLKPVADNQALTVVEDSVITITLSGSDPDGDVLTYTITRRPLHGSLSGTGASLVYRPNLNFNGNDTLQFIVNDGMLDSDPGKVIITVLAVNDAPVVTAQSYTTSLNTAVMIPLSAQDVDDMHFTFRITALPKYGTLDTSGISGGYVRYMPNPDSRSSDTIRYRAYDAAGLSSNEAVVTVFILTVNQKPVATPLRVDIDEDATQPIFLSGEDETPSQNLIYSITVPPKHGTFEGNFPSISYKTQRDYNGQDTFWYKVSDGSLESDPARVVITIHSVNDAPVVSLVSVSTGLGASVDIRLQAYDVDDLTFTFKMITGPKHGTADVSAVAGGLIRYTPSSTFKGLDTLTYQAYDDDTWASNIGYVIIAVALDNQPPVALADTVTLKEDDSLLITLEGSDIETGADLLVYSITQSPSHGSLYNKSGRNVWYKPYANYNGTDAFLFTVSDGSTTSGAARVWIVVTPVNDPPVAEPKTLTTPLGTPLLITLTASDPDGLTGLTFRISNPPAAHGIVDTTTIRTGKITYTPAAGFKGMDTIRFVARDVAGVESAPEKIVIGVALDNQPPVAQAQVYQISEDVNALITLRGSDIENSPLVFRVDSLPKHGLLTGTDSVRTFIPQKNYNGNDSLYYSAFDGQAYSASVKVLIKIAPVNDRPEARDTALTGLSEDETVQFELPCNDVDGDPLTVVKVAGPLHGDLVLLGGTTCKFTPEPEYSGADVFTFYARDAVMSSETVTVSLVIVPVNDAPVAVAPSPVSVNEDGSVVVTLTGTDIDGDAITFTVPSRSAHCVLVTAGDKVTISPDKDYNGPDLFAFTVSDGLLQSAPAEVHITVAPVNDAPEIGTIPDQTTNALGGFDDVVLDNYLHDVDNADAAITWEVTAVSISDISAVVTPTRALAVTRVNDTWSGSATVTVRATDPDGAYAEKEISYTVAANMPPGITLPHDTTINENTMLGPVAITLSDDGDVNALNLLLDGISDIDLIPATGITFSGSGKNRTITVTPAADKYGSATITITAQEPGAGGLSTTASFTVKVNGQPTIPASLAGTISSFGDSYSWKIDAVARDPEDASLSKVLFSTDGTNWNSLVTTAYGTISVSADSIKYVSVADGPTDGTPPYTDHIDFKVVDSKGFESNPAHITITINGAIIFSTE